MSFYRKKYCFYVFAPVIGAVHDANRCLACSYALVPTRAAPALVPKSLRISGGLLRELDVQLPEYDEIRADSSDLNDLQPAEYRADLVLILMRGSQKVLGVIVEVQLGRDADKPYAWPAYIANLHARHRCPVCLLVITIEDGVARWAGKSINVGPGTQCKPWVVGPSNTPAITALQDAQENVELAVLSAIEHGQSTETELARRIATAAIRASVGIDV